MNERKYIDLRSDTVTQPTPQMREAMCNAVVGDDVFGEDPTVIRLQEKAAELTGMESALFVPTGTMGNQIAVNVHTSPGNEVVVESRCHIYDYELGMLSHFSGVMPRVIHGEDGILSMEKIAHAVRPDIYYVSKTGLICLENTVNMTGGRIYPLETIIEIERFALDKNIPFHLDGARVFNAAAGLGISVQEICCHFDSVMFCLSKGLCSPVGSMLVGSRKFVEDARKVRKKLGGGMRQAGVIAAAGLVSLDNMVDRLTEDHKNAKLLAAGLAETKCFSVNPDDVETNIIIAEVKGIFSNSSEALNTLNEEGIFAVPVSNREVRFVTHNDVNSDDINSALETIRDL